MKSTFLTIVVLVFDMTVSADEETRISKIEHRSIAKASTTYVVKLEFCSSCLSEEENEWKETLGEVHTYAELKSDPLAHLPSSFTICSSVMTTYGRLQTLFTLLGKDRNKWLASFLQVDDETSFYWKWESSGWWVDVKLPPVFAHQWVRSCMAVNSESGLFQWVVDGTLLEDTTVAHVEDTKYKPTDLTVGVFDIEFY